MNDNNLSNQNISTYFYIRFLMNNLSPKRQKQLLFTSFLSILSAIAEFLSVTSILPLISILTSSKPYLEITNLGKFSFFINFFNIKSNPNLIILIFSLLAITSAFLRLFNFWYSGFIAGRVSSDIGVKLFRFILRSNYNLFLKHNSSDFITSLTYNIQSTVVVIQSILRAISSISIILVLTFALLIYNFQLGLLIIIVLSITYIVIYLKTKSRLIRNSEKIYHSRNNIISTLKDSFSSIRNIILDEADDIFVEKYLYSSYKEKSLTAQNNALQIAPKYFLESSFLILIGFLTLILTVYFKSLNPISFFGLLIMGAIKLLPAVQQIFFSISQIKSNQAALYEINSLLSEAKSQSRISESTLKNYKFKHKLLFQNISFKYSQEGQFILNNINLEINKGDSIGVYGKTGGGKSTFIDLIIGLLTPTKGIISLDGNILNSNNSLIKAWQGNISHVPQSIFLCDNTFAENIAFGINKDQIDYSRVKKAAQFALISDYIESLPGKYDSNVGENGIQLSGGQKQRVGIARALYNSKEILILDEATSALDENTEKLILDRLFNLRNKTIIIISHKMKTLKSCSKLFYVHDKQIDIDKQNI